MRVMKNNAEYTWYRVNAEQGGCPLCRAADNYCGNCPWTKYTKGTCTTAVGTTSFMSARNAISDSNKELINHYIGARIAELREWIKLEERT